MEIVDTAPFRIFFQVVSKEHEFIIHGEHVVTLKRNTMLTQVKSLNQGKFFVEYKDGAKFELQLPDFVIDYPLGNPYLLIEGEVSVTSLSDNLKAEGFFMKKKEKGFEPCKVRVLIYKLLDGEKMEVDSGNGIYSRYLKFGKLVYFRKSDPSPKMSAAENLLPSESLIRPEIEFIKEKKFSEADKILEGIENQEYEDQKKRKEGLKKRV